MNLKLYLYSLIFFINIIYFNDKAFSADTYPDKYVSIKSEDANVRVGPSMRYPIKWIYKRKNMPVKVISEFGQWKKIADIDNEGGWIHESLISNNKHVLIKNKVQKIYDKPTIESSIVMNAEEGVIAQLLECENNWCKIKISNLKGWVEINNLFGVY